MRVTGNLRKQSGRGYPQCSRLGVLIVDVAANAAQPHEKLTLRQPVVHEGQELPLKALL